jgi:DNA-binding PadR family transcriptional regulator
MSTPRQPSPEEFLPLPTAVFHILVALAAGDRHGYSIMQDVAARTQGKIHMSPGTLYAAIKRMLEQGLIHELKNPPDSSKDDERRRYYRITKFGHAVASAEATRLSELLAQAKLSGFLIKAI